MFLLWLIEKKCEEIESKFIGYQKSKVTKKIMKHKKELSKLEKELECIKEDIRPSTKFPKKYKKDMSPIRLLDGSLYYPLPDFEINTLPGISILSLYKKSPADIIDTDIEPSQLCFYETKEKFIFTKKSRRIYKNYISRR